MESLPFDRSECACDACKGFCRRMPGYLIPQDLDPMREALGRDSDMDLAGRFLLASPGAIVARGEHRFRIPTLVPRRDEDMRCVFFGKDERCQIHAASPFGCAYFDCEMTTPERYRRTTWGLGLLAKHPYRYYKLWFELAEHGMMAERPEVLLAQAERILHP